jgi:hypothetical protein
MSLLVTTFLGTYIPIPAIFERGHSKLFKQQFTDLKTAMEMKLFHSELKICLLNNG